MGVGGGGGGVGGWVLFLLCVAFKVCVGGGGRCGGAGERVGVYMGREWEWGCACAVPPGPSRRLIIVTLFITVPLHVSLFL